MNSPKGRGENNEPWLMSVSLAPRCWDVWQKSKNKNERSHWAVMNCSSKPETHPSLLYHCVWSMGWSVTAVKNINTYAEPFVPHRNVRLRLQSLVCVLIQTLWLHTHSLVMAENSLTYSVKFQSLWQWEGCRFETWTWRFEHRAAAGFALKLTQYSHSITRLLTDPGLQTSF